MRQRVFFGLGRKYDNGSQPAVGLNRRGVVLEVHKNEIGRTLYCRRGLLNQATIDWGQSKGFDSGWEPRVALNNNNVAVEVHRPSELSVDTGLWWQVGHVNVPGDVVRWSGKEKYDSGIWPSVAVNDAGVVVEMHRSQGNLGLWYNFGQLEGDRIRKVGKGYFGSSYGPPQVAINNSNVILMVYKHAPSKVLVYRFGEIKGNKLEFGNHAEVAPQGYEDPSVALTDDGEVIVTFSWGRKLYQRTGRVNGRKIEWWDDRMQYDSGSTTSVAAAGKMSVEVHQFLLTNEFSTSVITDRAGWMEQRLSTLGKKRLGDLVLPASHDSAMYKQGVSALGKTQDLTILKQLQYGIRYFDLRPWWILLPRPHFIIAHGDIPGPSLQTVLNDIHAFAMEGHREVVILKFSHFSKNINQELYQRMVEQIRAKIGPWLVTSTPDKKRLADVTLGEFAAMGNGPKIIVAVDKDFALHHPRTPGFWVYRDWYASKTAAAQGELRVFDRWSDTVNPNTMRGDQFRKFASYNGKMQNDSSLPCDLFLLSYTLTPPTAVWEFAKLVNYQLGQDIRFGHPDPVAIPNVHGKLMNALYVDYVEFARVTDVALFQNGERTTAVAPRKRAAKRSKK